MELQNILYVSSATRPLTEADMEHLLEGSRSRNAAAQVTGILLQWNGSFMQYIEGPPQGLNHIRQIIWQSPLHRDIVEIVNDTLRVRLFPLWSLAYRHDGFQSLSHPGQYAELLHPDLDQNDPTISPIIKLLNGFWNGPRMTGRS